MKIIVMLTLIFTIYFIVKAVLLFIRENRIYTFFTDTKYLHMYWVGQQVTVNNKPYTIKNINTITGEVTLVK